jgi:hypothetical protein
MNHPSFNLFDLTASESYIEAMLRDSILRKDGMLSSFILNIKTICSKE